ncbi:universal stress protein [Natronococcus wangiae]|uniref:universal stress protein n=1 Tax=Natronococcus wangiae TaxID=3068275 RepID=UPI00273EC85B|nr:universal stress protein [Natronococcus sp. AD5]
MGDRVLVPFDDGPLAADALTYVFTKLSDASVVALHVIDPKPGMNRVMAGGSFEEWYDEANRQTDELFDKAHRIADEYDRDIDIECEVGDPGQTIVIFAEENDIDGIVMGSHGRQGIARFLLGSVAEYVVERSPVPVTINKANYS